MAKLILAEVLKRKRVSKRQFAKRLGMAYHNVFRLFGPKVDPKLSSLTKYAKALKVKVKDLFRE